MSGREGTMQETLNVDTEIIKGDPGAGKTYELIQRLKSLAKQNTYGADTTIVTFSKTAVTDFEARLERTEPPEEDDGALEMSELYSASTMHSLCYGLANLPESAKIISMDDTPDEFVEFFDRVPDASFSDAEADPESLLAENGDMDDTPVGNQIIAAYNYVRSQGSGWELRHHTQDSVPVDVDGLPHYRVTEIMEAWEDYKEKNGLYQHHDYLRIVRDNGLSPESDVLIVDEFQDFNPLMYEVFEIWAEDAEKTIIAGDPKQSVYSFFGSSPKCFEAVDGVETRRSASRRCPENIVSVSRALLSRTPHDVSEMTAYQPDDEDRDPGVVRDVRVSPGEKGQVADLVRDLYDRHDNGEEWADDGTPARRVMLLARTRKGMHIMANALEDSSIPYMGVRRGDIPWWDVPAPQIYRLLTRYKNGDDVSANLTRWALPFFDSIEATDVWEMAVEGEMDKYQSGTVPHDELVDTFGGLEAEAVADKLLNPDRTLKNVRGDIAWISDRTADVIRDTFVSDADNMPAEIRVGTIHSAKGLEADSVVLSTGYGRDMRDRYETDENGIRDEEHRLFFVGASRASSELVALHGFHGSTEFPPLEDGVESLISTE